MKIKYFFVFVFILLLGYSCKKDEFKPILDFEYQEPEFVVVSNDDGEILFASNRKKMLSKILNGKSLRESGVRLDQDLVNITIGQKDNGFGALFYIDTYRDVSLDFVTKKRSNSDCLNETYNGDYFANRKKVELKIYGINDYDEFYFSYVGRAIKMESYLLVTMYLPGNIDALVTILPKGEKEYKSYLIQNDDWIKSDGIYSLKVNYSDFESPIVQSIKIPDNGIMTRNIVMKNKTGRNIELVMGSLYGYKKGDSFKYFLTPQMKSTLMELYMYLLFENSRSSYNTRRIISEFPINHLWDTLPMSLSPVRDNYSYNAVGDYSFVKVGYYFEHGTHWNVYQRPDAVNKFNFPSLPEEVLNLANIDSLYSWEIEKVLLYENENSFSKDKFESIDCLHYSKRSVGKLF